VSANWNEIKVMPNTADVQGAIREAKNGAGSTVSASSRILRQQLSVASIERPDAARRLAQAPVTREVAPAQIELAISPVRVPNLAPSIFRQRLVVEGTCPRPIDELSIQTFLSSLSDVCGMTALIEPVTHRSDRYGWAGWIHWETSGAHFYAWENPIVFFSADIYTCKAFDAMATVEFTRDFFDADRIVATGF
jgi:S-adenosylmethionine decarboxylase